MAKIRITKGIFGLREGIFTQTKTKNDPPFEVHDSIAARLVKQGVAEIVEGIEECVDELKNIANGKKANTVRFGENVKTKNKKEEKPENNGVAPSEEKVNEGSQPEEAEGTNEVSYSLEDTKKRLLEIASELGVEGVDQRLNKNQIIALLDEHTKGESSEESPSFDNVDGVVE